MTSDCEDAAADEQEGTRRPNTLTEADIDVVDIEIRIGRRSRLALSSSERAIYKPVGDFDGIDNRPRPQYDVRDLTRDGDHAIDADMYNVP